MAPSDSDPANGPPVGFGTAFLALSGLGLAVVALMGLPDAYEYRQGSGEGVQLFFPGLLLATGGVLASVAAAYLTWVACKRPRSQRGAPLVAAGLIVGALTLCTAAALYIESQYPLAPS